MTVPVSPQPPDSVVPLTPGMWNWIPDTEWEVLLAGKRIPGTDAVVLHVWRFGHGTVMSTPCRTKFFRRKRTSNTEASS
jgi:hypothetical protein